MPVLAPLHRAARLVRLPGRDLPGRVRLRRRRRGRARRPGQGGGRRRPPRWPSTGRAVAFPAPAEVRQDHRLQRAAAGRLAGRRRLGRDRRGAEAAQRVAQDPAHPRPAGVRDLRPRPGVHRSLAGRARRVRAKTSAPRRRTELLATAPGVGPDGRAHPARRRRPGPELRRPDPRRPGRTGRQGPGVLRQQRQPAQGRCPQRGADRRAGRRPAGSGRRAAAGDAAERRDAHAAAGWPSWAPE